MATTPIDNVPQLAPHIRALKSLGYGTLEVFVAAARVAGRDLSRHLNADVAKLVESLPSDVRASVMKASLPTRFALGAKLAGGPPIPPRAFRFSIAFTKPASSVNLIPAMPPVRHQGDRGTCVAHACLAAVEHYAGLQQDYKDMSEQYLYWNCKQNDGVPTEEGTWIRVAMSLLERDGCCLESTWPYNPVPVPGNEGQNPPPSGALAEALQYLVTPFHALAPTSVQDLKNELARNRCVPFSVPVFNSWYQNSEVTRTGDIVLPIPDEQYAGGHAMCLVGYEDLPGEMEIGGGRFLLRNSWGASWGRESSYGPGYGTIPYAYLARHGVEAYSTH
jgi:hypothetical protein